MEDETGASGIEEGLVSVDEMEDVKELVLGVCLFHDDLPDHSDPLQAAESLVE